MSPDSRGLTAWVRSHPIPQQFLFAPNIIAPANDSYHRLGPRRFSQKHNLDIRAIVRKLNAKPVIRIKGGWFVTYLGKPEVRLGANDAGEAGHPRGFTARSRESDPGDRLLRPFIMIRGPVSGVRAF